MKKLLLSLFVWLIWLISFCSAEFVGWITCDWNSTICWYIYPPADCNWSRTVYLDWWWNSFQLLWDWWQSSYPSLTSRLVTSTCTYIQIKKASFWNATYPFVVSYWTDPSWWWSCPECPTCPSQYTSEECQSEYWLVSSWLLNTCENNYNNCQSNLESCQSSLSWWNNTLNNCSNNLLSCESSLASCIQSNCPIDTWDVMWSSLWINWIQHLWKSIINVSIPDNIYWDYTTNEESFDLYVGSGYDQEYIDWIISINSYSPTSEDFTSIFVSGLTLIMPYIIFALFIVFLWKLIKRIFK